MLLVVVGRTLVDEDAPRSPTLERAWPQRGLRLDRLTIAVIESLDDDAARTPAIELAHGRGPDSFGLAVLGGDVYWSATRASLLLRTPAAGGPTVELSSAPGGAYAIAVDASGLYALTQVGDVVRVPLAGGVPAPVVGGLRGAHDVAVDDASIYVTDEPRGRVLRFAKEGGAPLLVAASQSQPLDVVTDGDRVLWTSAGAVVGASRFGGPVEVHAADQRRPHGIAVDATHVYWVTPRALRRAPIDGGATETLFEGLWLGWAVAVSATHAFATVPHAGAVIAVPIAGGPPRLVAARRGKPEALAVADGRVLWADEADGALYAAPLPR